MKNRQNFEFTPKMLLIVLTGICILLLAVSTVFKNSMKPFSAIAGTFVVPMQDGINSFGIWVDDHMGSVKSRKELQKENKELAKKVEQLTRENEELSSDKKELDSLREMLKLDQQYAGYKKVGAKIISKGSGNWYHTFVLNKGTADGIKVNMNVLAGNGLVGIVTETGRNYAKVRAIIDDNSSVSAKSTRTGDTCVAKGNSESVEKDGTIDVTYISKDADIKAGDELVTSHISSKYLEGIRIGTIEEISVDSSNLTKSARVTPAVDFEHLEDVLVITDLKQVPKDAESAD
ncbi:MAG: rod shape-determining protein MreC [Eubacterium sp.]|nr:rod shape-determining protein MreC [Eubacterium sp.]MDD7209284.1 rod shape-determining protein MreC [Lachnospiraceae bacterium]MDY5497348.1 rod shape-determining protein MreC [Anaerobutyricum sp.]